MFERYTEKARLVVFHARIFASELGGSSIEPEHIALAILQEDPGLFGPKLKSPETCQALRAALEGQVRQTAGIPTSADMPLSPSAKSILAAAEGEAERAMHPEIRPSDLLAGLLRDPTSATAETVRSFGAETPHGTLFFVAASNSQAPPPDTGELHRLIDRLPESQLSRAQLLLQALLGDKPY